MADIDMRQFPGSEERARMQAYANERFPMSPQTAIGQQQVRDELARLAELDELGEMYNPPAGYGPFGSSIMSDEDLTPATSENFLEMVLSSLANFSNPYDLEDDDDEEDEIEAAIEEMIGERSERLQKSDAEFAAGEEERNQILEEAQNALMEADRAQMQGYGALASTDAFLEGIDRIQSDPRQQETLALAKPQFNAELDEDLDVNLQAKVNELMAQREIEYQNELEKRRPFIPEEGALQDLVKDKAAADLASRVADTEARLGDTHDITTYVNPNDPLGRDSHVLSRPKEHDPILDVGPPSMTFDEWYKDKYGPEGKPKTSSKASPKKERTWGESLTRAGVTPELAEDLFGVIEGEIQAGALTPKKGESRAKFTKRLIEQMVDPKTGLLTDEGTRLLMSNPQYQDKLARRQKELARRMESKVDPATGQLIFDDTKNTIPDQINELEKSAQGYREAIATNAVGVDIASIGRKLSATLLQLEAARRRMNLVPGGTHAFNERQARRLARSIASGMDSFNLPPEVVADPSNVSVSMPATMFGVPAKPGTGNVSDFRGQEYHQAPTTRTPAPAPATSGRFDEQRDGPPATSGRKTGKIEGLPFTDIFDNDFSGDDVGNFMREISAPDGPIMGLFESGTTGAPASNLNPSTWKTLKEYKAEGLYDDPRGLINE